MRFRYGTAIQVFRELWATKSIPKKIAILKEYSDIGDVKALFSVALNPNINFDIEVPEYRKSKTHGLSLTRALYKLVNENQAGRLTQNRIAFELEAITEEDAHLICMAIKGDMRAGVKEKSIRKIWPNIF